MTKDLSVHDKAILNCIFNPSLPLSDILEREDIPDLEDNDDDVPDSIKRQEYEAIYKAETKDYENALKLINDCINKMPSKASLYNNRAQVLLFMQKPDDAFKDVSKAIELADDQHKKTRCEAFCQRAILHKKFGRDDEAREDFTAAANLGSMFAKSQLVALNPYAALCNQMLKKAFDELK